MNKLINLTINAIEAGYISGQESQAREIINKVFKDFKNNGADFVNYGDIDQITKKEFNQVKKALKGAQK